MATADLITQLKQDFDDVYAAGKTAGGSGGGNVGYKTTEVKITSNVTNAFQLLNMILPERQDNHLYICSISKPKNEGYVNNQVLYFVICDKDYFKCGLRYRDGAYGHIYMQSSYIAAVTIGDIYTVVDLDEYVEDKDYEQGYEDGKNSVTDNLRYVKQAQIASFNLFNKPEIKLNLDNAISLYGFCSVRISAGDKKEWVNTTVEKLTVNCPNLITVMNRFLYCDNISQDKTLKTIILNVDTQKANRLDEAFVNLTALETIGGKPLDFTSCTVIGGFMRNCHALKEFRVVANTIKVSLNIVQSTLLSTETIQSIIDGLADLTGGTAQTLTLHATVGSKLTDEQKATITAKNWELVY